MNKKLKNFSSLFFVFLLCLGVLCSCSKKAPEDILVKAKQALVDLDSGKFKVIAELTGNSEKDVLAFKGGLDTLFKKDPATKQFMLNMKLDFTGSMKSTEKNFDLAIVAEFISKGAQYYAKITNFKTSEPSLQFFLPLIDLYKGKWLHLAEGFIPENIAGLQVSQQDAVKTKQLNDLFVQADLFKIKEDKGVEKINGHDTYDLLLELNPQGFQDYFRQVATINGVKISDSELLNMIAPLKQIQEVEVYLDTEKYYIYDANLVIETDSVDKKSKMQIKLSLEGSEFDRGVEISVPESAEEFNPLALPADLGFNPTLPQEPTTTSDENSSSSSVDLSITP